MTQDRPLEKPERDLLAVILSLHAERGPMLRDAVSVVARGQGLEFGRALASLRSLGLVEEVLKRPFFLARWLGVKPVMLIRPTAAGLALALPPTAPVAAPAADQGGTEQVGAEPVAQAAAPAVAAPPSPPAPTPVPAPAVAPVTTAVVEAAREAAKPAPERKPRRQANLGYTEDMGGAPIDMPAQIAPTVVDDAILADIGETLDVVGLTLTDAGVALVNARVTQGVAPGDTLLKVILYGLAHALRLDALSQETLDKDSTRQYMREVLVELGKLRDAGAMDPAVFESDSAEILRLLQAGPESLALCDALLADPIGGAAPPCLLPEELRLPVEPIGEPTY